MRCALIGDPAEHSLSPAIHRDGYVRSGLDWRYDAITVSPADLDCFVSDCVADPQWAGLSVTAPHKEAVVAFGEPDHVTRLVGAGNTIVFHDRSPGNPPTIHNTDVPGFVRAWRARGLPAPRTAAIVGNGATARSILVALAGLHLTQAVVLARDPGRAARIVELGIALGIDTTVQPLEHHLPDVDLVASTIPAAATEPHADAWAASAQYLFDAVYHPWPTPLGAAAADHHTVLTGLDLLAGQAVDQFHLLTGGSVTFDDCHAAAAEELRRRGPSMEE
ncbi:MAG: shikimate dehydrogenase [Propionibacteriaceae bacterium]|nr:shikimate dehydrogenase [Propionibacteriaceae bacterium]